MRTPRSSRPHETAHAYHSESPVVDFRAPLAVCPGARAARIRRHPEAALPHGIVPCYAQGTANAGTPVKTIVRTFEGSHVRAFGGSRKVQGPAACRSAPNTRHVFIRRG